MHAIKTSLVALASLASATVFAQSTTVPAANCVRPDIPAADKPLSDAAAKKINESSKTYADCAAAYHAARKAAVEETNQVISRATAAAQANVEAANKMQQDLNAFLAELSANADAREKARGGK